MQLNETSERDIRNSIHRLKEIEASHVEAYGNKGGYLLLSTFTDSGNIFISFKFERSKKKYFLGFKHSMGYFEFPIDKMEYSYICDILESIGNIMQETTYKREV